MCFEAFKEGEKVRVLPRCKHVFHSQCVDEWLAIAPSCPICRKNVKRGLRRERKARAESPAVTSSCVDVVVQVDVV